MQVVTGNQQPCAGIVDQYALEPALEHMSDAVSFQVKPRAVAYIQPLDCLTGIGMGCPDNQMWFRIRQ